MSPLNPYVLIMCFIHSLEFLYFCYPLDCIMTLMSYAGLVTKETMNPATAPFYSPSIKVRFSFPLIALYFSQAVNRTELTRGLAIRGQQTPLKSCEYPSCLIIYFKTLEVEVSSGFICILTLTVSRKKPERQPMTPEAIPLVKSIRLFIIFNLIIVNKIIIKLFFQKKYRHMIYWFLTE